MIDAGDMYVVDVNDELRRPVLVVSADRFHRRSDRALVVPQISVAPADEPFPWRIDIDGATYAVDRMRSLAVRRLLEPIGRATPAQLLAVRRAIRQLTA